MNTSRRLLFYFYLRSPKVHSLYQSYKPHEEAFGVNVDKNNAYMLKKVPFLQFCKHSTFFLHYQERVLQSLLTHQGADATFHVTIFAGSNCSSVISHSIIWLGSKLKI